MSENSLFNKRCKVSTNMVLLACRTLLAIIALISWAGTVNAQKLVQISVLHRHGARTEPFVSDHGLNWNFCVLSDEGVVMALNLGSFIKKQYSDFLLPYYDPISITSQSTDFERTIRTGVGLLRGMYNGSLDIPYLSHIPQDTDDLLGYYYSWPSAVLGTHYIASYNERHNAATLSYFPQEKLNIIGDELGCPHLCLQNQTLCALLGEDVTTCRLSNGGLSSNLSNLLSLEFQAQEDSNSFLYMYNESDEYWRNTGPYGRLLAVRISNRFNDTLQRLGTASPSPIRMWHYSAHDITIYGYFVAIGAINSTTDPKEVDLLVPTFASVVILELYDDGNVRLRFAECNQTYGSGYEYKFIDRIVMGCKSTRATSDFDTTGIYYAATCPLEHYRNFVDTKRPYFEDIGGPDKPWCYADPADAVANGCEPDNPTPPTSPHCKSYRRLCAEFACDAKNGYVLNMSNLACVKLRLGPRDVDDHPDMTPGWYAGVIAASLVTGAILGTLVKFFSFERVALKKEEKALLSNQEDRQSAVSLRTGPLTGGDEV